MAERVQKLLAAAGAGSRRKMEEMIKSGAVTVNGRVCKPGEKAEPSDTFKISGRKIDCAIRPEQGRVIAYNKPAGKIVSRNDPANIPSVFDDLPPLKKSRWISVGRLDVNTSGLLLFCSDGGLANRLSHPSGGIEREYMARVRGDAGDETVRKLLKGFPLDGKNGRFEKAVPASRSEGGNNWFKITVKEGRNRFVRRMWEKCGCEVGKLKRIRFGTVKLPKNMPAGTFFFVEGEELEKLHRTLSM